MERCSNSNNIDGDIVVLITGGNGWLGQFLHKELSNLQNRQVIVHITYNTKAPGAWIDPLYAHKVNLASEEESRVCLTSVNPNVIIHLAALTSPVLCERDPSLAERINCPTHVIETVKELNKNCLFIFTSTDLVYDGESSPYFPSDSSGTPLEQAPLTTYGKTKLSFEDHVLQLRSGVVLRLSNMIGPNYCYEQVGGKFLQWLRGAVESKEYCGLFHDQFRSFVSVLDVASLVSKIVQSYLHQYMSIPISSADGSCGHAECKLHGVFNVGGPRGCSRLDLARILCRSTETPLEIHEEKLEGFQRSDDETWTVFKSSNQNSFIAPGVLNPRDVTMDSSNTEQNFGFTFSSMETAIPEFILI